MIDIFSRFNCKNPGQKWSALKIGLLILAMAASVLPARPQDTAPAPIPLYVAGPPTFNQGLCFRELFEHPDDWKEARSHIDRLLTWDGILDYFTEDELKRWFAQMRQWNIRLEIEGGGVKEWGGQTGESTFRAQEGKWDRLQSLGADFASFVMDEPLCCVREYIKKPDDYAVTETANFIALMRHKYPQLVLGEVEPYPYIPVHDHGVWIAALQKKLAEMNVKGIEFYRLDVDWTVFDVRNEGSWKEVKQIENDCRKNNVPFSLIYWAANAGYLEKNCHINDESNWYVGTMAMANSYATVGGAPQQYVIEDYTDTPSHSTPETADFTFTRSALDLAKKLHLPEHSNNP